MSKLGNSASACGNPIERHSCPGNGAIFWSISHRLFPMERIDILSAPSTDKRLRVGLLQIRGGMRHSVSWYNIVENESRLVSIPSLFRNSASIRSDGHANQHIACAGF
jgi:hypothetical protein